MRRIVGILFSHIKKSLVVPNNVRLLQGEAKNTPTSYTRTFVYMKKKPFFSFIPAKKRQKRKRNWAYISEKIASFRPRLFLQFLTSVGDNFFWHQGKGRKRTKETTKVTTSRATLIWKCGAAAGRGWKVFAGEIMKFPRFRGAEEINDTIHHHNFYSSWFYAPLFSSKKEMEGFFRKQRRCFLPEGNFPRYKNVGK